ncbi:MAG: hypothetical protein WDW36_008308 [Sanguina aurantia]
MVKRDEPELVAAATSHPVPAPGTEDPALIAVPSKRARWESTPTAGAGIPAAAPYSAASIMANAQVVAAAVSAAPSPPSAAAAAPGSKPGVTSDALERMKANLAASKARIEALKQSKAAQAAAAAGGGGSAGALPSSAVPGMTAASFLAAQQRASAVAASFGALAGRAGAPSTSAVQLQPPPAAAPGPRPAAQHIVPLRLDAQGREVDEMGKLVQHNFQVVTTLRVNAPGRDREMRDAAEAAAAAAAAAPEGSREEDDGSRFFDARMAGRSKGERKRRPAFEFVQEGKFQREAAMMRLKAQYGEDAVKQRSGPVLPGSGSGFRMPGPKNPGGGFMDPNMTPIGTRAPSASMDPNAVPLGPRRPLQPSATDPMDLDPASAPTTATAAATATEAAAPEPLLPAVPEVEWWDKRLLLTGSYDADVTEAGVAIHTERITDLVEHPIPLEPPAEAPPPPPQPLKLTKRELKKLRTQRRQAREKEKQELIQQGLLEPPKPKVKISNLHRVLGEAASLDPTAIDRETRKQMAERQSAHDDRNLARKLLPAEKKDKKLRRLFDDDSTAVGTTASVYRVDGALLANAQHMFKVDVNAKENHMTGVVVRGPTFSLVVVEGCGKSSKRYAKLMLRRIDWSLKAGGVGGGHGMDDEDENNAEEEEAPVRPAHACELVWQGTVAKPAFPAFTREKATTEEEGKTLLAKSGVGHYWDVAAAFVPGEMPSVTL